MGGLVEITQIRLCCATEVALSVPVFGCLSSGFREAERKREGSVYCTLWPTILTKWSSLFILSQWPKFWLFSLYRHALLLGAGEILAVTSNISHKRLGALTTAKTECIILARSICLKMAKALYSQFYLCTKADIIYQKIGGEPMWDFSTLRSNTILES